MPTAPVHSLSNPVTTGINLHLTWSGGTDTGGSGFAGYVVQQSVDGGAYTDTRLADDRRPRCPDRQLEELLVPGRIARPGREHQPVGVVAGHPRRESLRNEHVGHILRVVGHVDLYELPGRQGEGLGHGGHVGDVQVHRKSGRMAVTPKQYQRQREGLRRWGPRDHGQPQRVDHQHQAGRIHAQIQYRRRPYPQDRRPGHRGPSARHRRFVLLPSLAALALAPWTSGPRREGAELDGESTELGPAAGTTRPGTVDACARRDRPHVPGSRDSRWRSSWVSGWHSPSTSPEPGGRPRGSPSTACRRRTCRSAERVDIGGRSLYLDCRGEGSPTVVLEAGMGSGAGSWSTVFDELATTTRTCAYDRPGLGSSDARGRHTLADTVDDLRRALDVAGEVAPFVLVGHSHGGDYVRVFGGRYHDEVAGLVLVDTLRRGPPHGLDPSAAGRGLAAGVRGEPGRTCVRWSRRSRTWTGRHRSRSCARRRSPASRSRSSGRPAGSHAWTRPRTRRFAEAIIAAYESLSPGHVHFELAWGAGHLIQIDRPDMVIAATRRLVEAARAGSR